MDKNIEAYWQNFASKFDEQPQLTAAWQFGADADTLAELVIKGIKTATCSAHILYEKENKALPEVGEYHMILDSGNQPRAIIQITDVSVMPMNEVPESFAYAEGEGDRSYDYWWRVHEDFFKTDLKPYGVTFKPDMLLVCERFKVVDSKEEA